VKDVCKDRSILYNQFTKYVQVEDMKFVFGENNRNMCLVKVPSIEEALKAMAHMHNVDFGGRKI